MRVDVSGLVGGVLTGHSCPPEPSVPSLMVLSAPEGWTLFTCHVLLWLRLEI